MDSKNSIGFVSVPLNLMPTLEGITLPDAAAWTREIARLEELVMSPEIEQHWKPLLLREMATCIFLRHGGKCRDDVDLSVALFEATADSGLLFSPAWVARHLYHFCVVLRISFEDLGKGAADLPNGIERRRLEVAGSGPAPPFPVTTVLEFAGQLGCIALLGKEPDSLPACLDETIALLRAAYTSSYVIRSETKLVALEALVMALLTRFHASSRAEDIAHAFEYAYMRFDVVPGSADLLPTLDLCIRIFRNLHTNLPTLELADTICHSMSQRSRIHAIPHKAILFLWYEVLVRHLALTGRCESVHAFRLSVDKTILSEEFPENEKAEPLLHAGMLLFMTCFSGPHGCAEQMHEAAFYLHAALSCPECPIDIRSLATWTLRSLHITRHFDSYHPSDFEQVSRSLNAELAEQVEAVLTGEALATDSLRDTVLDLIEHRAISAQATIGSSSPEETLQRLDEVVSQVHMLEAPCSTDREHRTKYLRCAAICHLQRFRLRNHLVQIQVFTSMALYRWRTSISEQEVEEDYASAISYARELIKLADVGGGEIDQDKFFRGVDIFYEAVELKYMHPEQVLQPKLEEIDETIALVSSLPYHGTRDSFMHRALHSKKLITLLSIRTHFKYDPAVVEDIIRRITSLLEDPWVRRRPRQRIELAMTRAAFMQEMAYPAVSQAFREGLELSEEVFSSAPTLEAQFESLKVLSGYFSAAVYHSLNQGELRAVVELLEQGRGLLWTHMRRFRTSVDQLVHSADARSRMLGEAFRTTSLELETLVMSAIPKEHLSPASQSSSGSVSARMADKNRLRAKLADIVDEIRTCPGFDDFLRLPSFDTIQQAAIEGPVIMVSCNSRRSFALILLSYRDPVYIDLNHTTFNRLCAFLPTYGRRPNGLIQLGITRTISGPESCAYDTALKEVLEIAVQLIVGPVVEKLDRLGFKPGTGQRIWWCPVGAACMIPLHAAGPFTKPYKGKYLPDLYTSSYTPSLSALIEARAKARTSVSSSDTTSPTMLIVGQPGDPSLINADEEIHTVLSLLPLNTTPTLLLDEDASLAAVRSAMNDHSWLHMACHGLSDHEVPTQSAFQLSGDDELTLRDIIKLRLPRAEFAFLSACSTAEFNLRPAGGTLEGESFDEVFHLSAAMQFCGFRGVVGTMWTVNDEDGVEVARHFYRELSRKGGEVGQVEDWDPRDAASALNKAVRKLKRKLKGERGSLERWVNFIHVGI